MLNRRELLKLAAACGTAGFLPPRVPGQDLPEGIEVNDMQSLLNATRVRNIEQPRTLDGLQASVRGAIRSGSSISVAGGRHAMGGQQFGKDTILIDTTGLVDVLHFDREKGLLEVGAGIQWPELMEYLDREQQGADTVWGIREKQTGVDKVCLGGSLSSNVHGRGLRFAPIVQDVESFVLVDAEGTPRLCSRTENPELFSLAIGGYGLFGVMASVTLRLVPRTKVQRHVEVIPVRDLMDNIGNKIADGYLYGDCQYATSLDCPVEEHAGVVACYKPVSGEVSAPGNQKQLSSRDWAALYQLARTDKQRAFETYSRYYLSTNGQVYWSDRHQLSGDFQDYRVGYDTSLGTDMITEAYVSHENFVPFMGKVRQDFIDHGSDMTYGTIRFIEQDNETFLRWAPQRQVCIVCNLHVRHTPEGIARAAEDFRRIIDRAIEFGGRYYLTYHRWATRRQVEACYPQFVEFLRLKRKYDPHERFQSNWYRHYREMFGDVL